MSGVSLVIKKLSGGTNKAERHQIVLPKIGRGKGGIFMERCAFMNVGMFAPHRKPSRCLNRHPMPEVWHRMMSGLLLESGCLAIRSRKFVGKSGQTRSLVQGVPRVPDGGEMRCLPP
jgi:hypothetical protein